MTNITDTAAPAADAIEAPAISPASGDTAAGGAPAKPARGAGRKLRTPFRRRRADAATDASPQTGANAEGDQTAEPSDRKSVV